MTKVHLMFTLILLSISPGCIYSDAENKSSVENHQGHKNKSEAFLEHLPAFNAYEIALIEAEKLNKPVLIYFTGHACANTKKMESSVLNDEKISSFMDENFILLKLYVDDRLELSEEEWITNPETNEILKTISQQNQYIEQSLFGQISQPYFVIINHKKKIFGQSGLEGNKEIFYKFISESFDKFKVMRHSNSEQ